MKKFLIVLASVYFALIFLMPKEQLFYTLKSLLRQQKITVGQGSVKDRLFDLKIEDVKIFYDGIESVAADYIDIKPWLLYNSIVAEDLRSGKDIKKMFDLKEGSVRITQAFWHPLSAKIEAEGNFGKIDGEIDLKEGKIKLICEPSGSFKRSRIFRELFRKKDEGYVYESLLK